MEQDLATEATTVALWRLGRYALREKLGSGGMGVVYRAVDANGRDVAVKLLHPQVAGDAESRERFAREADILSRVRGHHIAEVLDADIAAETPYLVTRYVPGAPLQDVVDRDGPFRGAALEALAADLVDALCSVHEAGVVHRDLKPANVLVCDGEAYVIDFGIAQIADETRLTVPGMVYGTPGYLAPELLAGGEVSPAADVHAWAATVAFAATGRPPFGSGQFNVVSYAVVHKDPDLDGVPGWLAPTLRSALAKDPAERPAVRRLRDWTESVDIGSGGAADGIPTQAVRAGGAVGGALGPGVERPFNWATDAADDWSEVSAEDEPAQEVHTAALPVAEPEPERPGREAPDDVDAADLDEGALDEAGAVEPEAPRHRLVTVLLFAALTGLGAVLPAFAAVGLLAWLVLARTVDRSATFLAERRVHRGRRRLDAVAATAALPWHLARSLGVTLLVLPVAMVVAGLAVLLVALVVYASGLAPRPEFVSAGAVLVVALTSWWTVQRHAVQRGSRRVLDRVVGAREFAVVVGLVLSVAVGALVVLTLTGVVSYWPAEEIGVSGTDLADWWTGVTTPG